METAADWNPSDASRLWAYHLHYHHFLLASTASDPDGGAVRFVERWIKENPPAIGPGWEPYPVSRRILAWIDRILTVGDLPEAAIASLAVQARWLRRRIENHIQANHVFVNAAALVAAGLFFSGNEGEQFLKKGTSLLVRELNEQFLSDGGHYERSAMYHAQLLEDLLRVVALHRAYCVPIPADVIRRIPDLIAWMNRFTHPDGGIVLFNDAAFDGALLPRELLRYATDLGFRVDDSFNADGVIGESGYVRCDRGPATLFVDVAPIGPDHQPGHAHADTLGFEFSLGCQRVLVDSGTSLYGIGTERLRQRGTAAHNTVVVDGADSSEVWSGFRVGRRARIRESSLLIDGDAYLVSGAHDGYRRYRKNVTHRRIYRFDFRSLVIDDFLEGCGTHDVEVPFHLHPDIAINIDGYTAHLSYPGARIDVELDRRLSWVCEATTWHPFFGRSVPSSKLVGRGQVNPSGHWTVIFRWSS